jgi:hypothetical protein
LSAHDFDRWRSVLVVLAVRLPSVAEEEAGGVLGRLTIVVTRHVG